jgi:aspartate racemase
MQDAAPLIGVLGGMGPLATVDFLQKLIASTPAQRDQDHVPTVVWNVPQIPDRQKALAGTGESPLPAMLHGIAQLNAAGASRIVIPCNTAHAWFDALAAASQAQLIHIVHASLDALQAPSGPSGATVGLIATRGTLNARLYQPHLEARGIPFVVNTPEELDSLFTPGCYAIKQGELERGGKLLELAAQRLVERGAARLVLACTEVPVGLAHIGSGLMPISVDPTQALADACLAYWRQAA